MASHNILYVHEIKSSGHKEFHVSHHIALVELSMADMITFIFSIDAIIREKGACHVIVNVRYVSDIDRPHPVIWSTSMCVVFPKNTIISRNFTQHHAQTLHGTIFHTLINAC